MQNDMNDSRTNGHESTEGVPPIGRDNLTESDLRQMIENRDFLLEQYRNLVAHLAPIWQPIETAPKDGTQVLIFEDDIPEPMIVIAFYQSGEWLVAWDHQTFRDATHWMPLPAPPETTP